MLLREANRALGLAKTSGWTLLAGDRSLRQAAEEEAIEVHGTLWLVERMVTTQVINVEQAATAFDLMRENHRRLPWNEVDVLIAQLGAWSLFRFRKPAR